MINQIITATLVGLSVIIGTALAGYYRIKNTENVPNPSPEATASSAPVPEPSPTVTSPSPPAASPATPSTEEVKTNANHAITISQKTTTKSSENEITSPSSDQLGISFVNIPSTVRSGQNFTVEWRVNGPAGTKGEETTLQVNYEATSSSGNSHSAAKSTSSQSFGSFSIPETFETNLSFGGASETIHLTASATVGDKTITTTDSIKLVN